MTRAYIRADISDELLKQWLQHLRDFDTANPGCHFEICVDGPDIPMRDMVETLRLNPALKFSDIFERAKLETTDGHAAEHVEEIVDRIRPILTGHAPQILGGVLADLVAIWLAGHVGADGHIDRYREKILADLVETIKKLVPVEVALLQERRGG